MRSALVIAVLALRCHGYQLTGKIEPPTAVPVFLHGATKPFESSTISGDDGRFQFGKIPAGIYTLIISTAARGDLVQTVELTSGTVDSKGRLDIVLRINTHSLESEGGHATSATVSAIVLSVPDRAAKEYVDAQRCLSGHDDPHAVVCASGHLRRAVGIAPRFTAAWNQLGTIAYQASDYHDAETDFRKALEADPEAFEPLVNLGGVLLNLERPREALEYNRQAASRRPNDALANSQLGLSYFGLNAPELAEKYLKVAVQLDPAHFSHPQLTLARIYVQRGDRASAIDELRDFLKRHPDSPQASAVRAEITDLSR